MILYSLKYRGTIFFLHFLSNAAMLPHFLLHSSLFFALISTSSWVAAHTDPKINEFSDYGWYGSISIRTTKIFIAKVSNFSSNTPTYSHEPMVDECVGIDSSTLSVYIVQFVLPSAP